jgi:type I restriction enzyme S subunit
MSKEGARTREDVLFVNADREYREGKAPAAGVWPSLSLPSALCRSAPSSSPRWSALISVRAPVGTLNVADREYGIGRGLAAVVGRRRSSRYFAYAIEALVSWLHARSQGSTFLAIGSADLLSLPIPVRVKPSADELAAEQLDAIDSQITHTEALIAKQERVRAGLMQDLFIRGPPREEAPELYRETELG